MIYKLKIEKTIFFLISDKIKAKNIYVDKDYIHFKTDKTTLNYLLENEVPYEYLNSLYSKLKQALFINKGLLFGILLFVNLIYINQYRVSKVVFNDEFIINEQIQTTLESRFKRFLFWDFNTSNLEQSAREFRHQFISYQWITIEKKGSVVEVNISNYDEFNINPHDKLSGDIVAKKEGIIKYYNIFSGGKNVEINKYVKQGDILIASDLLINQQMDRQDLTEARGLVLANTFERFTHTIYKQEPSTTYTSKVNSFKQIKLFNFNINLKRQSIFDDYKETSKTTFSLFGIFQIKQIEQREKCDIIRTYDEKEAVEFFKSTIEKDFYSNVVSELERIELMQVINIVENTDSFTISILVQKLESIGIFRPLE